jgi:hypothetical protein
VITLVIVVLATVAGASAFVAMRASRERDQARQDLTKAADAVNEYALTAAKHKDLSGLKMEPVRQELLEKALKYYQSYVNQHAADEPPSGDVAKAYLLMAGLQAKLGSKESVTTLNNAMNYMERMRKANADAESYPSLQEGALKLAAPNEWMIIKRAGFQEIQQHGLTLYLALQHARLTLRDLTTAHPQNIQLRDDYAALLAASAQMQVRMSRHKLALTNWRNACSTLEALIRDVPDNSQYKARLADALVGLGQAQKTEEKDYDGAIGSQKRAIELREQLAQADAKDEAMAKQLTTARNELAKLESAAASAKATAAKASAPAADSETETPDKQPAADQSAEEKDAPADSEAKPAADAGDAKDAAADPAQKEPAGEAQAQAPPAAEPPADEKPATP